MSDAPFTNQVALVTGGARGLGAAIALRLAQEGADVVIADRNREGAEQTAAAIAQESGRRALALPVDITNEAQVAAMVKGTVEGLGRLDILVANAGILMARPITDFPLQEWQAVLDVNLTGYFLCAKYAARQMMAQQRGNIIQINSISSQRTSGGNSAYVASKWGGIGLTRSLARELVGHGIRVNAICPGHLLDSPLWTESLYDQYAARDKIPPEAVRQRYLERIPMGRGGTYEDVCNAVVFLASEQSSYITGQSINVSGGEV